MNSDSQSAKLVYVDIGSMGGAKYNWPSWPNVYSVLFDPNDSQDRTSHNTLHLTHALGDKIAHKLLWITKSAGCCSLLKPNVSFLQHYSIAPAFHVIDCMEVSVVPYQDLYHQGVVPQPDVIKVDVQGYEWWVLQGFGDLLNGVLVIEMEVSLYQIYENQITLGAMCNYLAEWNFSLASLKPIYHWDGDLVEFDAVFIKRPHAVVDLGPHAQSKLNAVIRDLCITSKSSQFAQGFKF